MLRKGHGVERRLPLASKMLLAAALRGDDMARDELAHFRADVEAEANVGSMLAALSLAKMYERGIGVEPDLAFVFRAKGVLAHVHGGDGSQPEGQPHPGVTRGRR
jgi:TPR repeat protein